MSAIIFPGAMIRSPLYKAKILSGINNKCNREADAALVEDSVMVGV